MKLHLPKGLRSAVLACMAVVGGFATTVGTGIIAGGAITIAFSIPQAQADLTWKGGSGAQDAAAWAKAENWSDGTENTPDVGAGPAMSNGALVPIIIDGKDAGVTFGANTDAEQIALEGWYLNLNLQNNVTLYANAKKFQRADTATGDKGAIVTVDKNSHLYIKHNGNQFQETEFTIGADSSITLALSADRDNNAMLVNLNSQSSLMNFVSTDANQRTLSGPITIKATLADVAAGENYGTRSLGTLSNVTLSNLKYDFGRKYTLSNEAITDANYSAHMGQYYVDDTFTVTYVELSTDADCYYSAAADFVWKDGCTVDGNVVFNNGDYMTFASTSPVVATLEGAVNAKAVLLESGADVTLSGTGSLATNSIYFAEDGKSSLTISTTGNDLGAIKGYEDGVLVLSPGKTATLAEVIGTNASVDVDTVFISGTGTSISAIGAKLKESDLVVDDGAILNVDDAWYNRAGATLTIQNGAHVVRTDNANHDKTDYGFTHWDSAQNINILSEGVLELHDTRMCIDSYDNLYLSDGHITGNGQGNYGSLDFQHNGAVVVSDGTSTIDAPVRLRTSGSTTEFQVNTGTLTIKSTIASGAGNLKKTGAGELIINTMGNGGTATVEAGKLTLNGLSDSATVGKVVVNSGATLQWNCAVNHSGTYHAGGNLVLGNAWNFTGELEFKGGTYSDGTDGYRTSQNTLVSADGDITLGDAFSVNVNGAAVTDYTNQDGKLTYTSTDTHTYWVYSKELAYDSAKMDAAAEMGVKNGGSLMLDATSIGQLAKTSVESGAAVTVKNGETALITFGGEFGAGTLSATLGAEGAPNSFNTTGIAQDYTGSVTIESGKWTIGNQQRYSGGTTIKEGATLTITGGGGGSGAIRGTANVLGGTLELASTDATGYNADNNSLRVINLGSAEKAGGTLLVSTAGGAGGNQTLGGATINMYGGTITSPETAPNSTLDLFRNSSAINVYSVGGTAEAPTESSISIGLLGLRQDNTQIMVAENARLTISSRLADGSANNNDGNNALIKTGAGELVLAGKNSATGDITVSAGTLTLAATGELSSGTKYINSGATLRAYSGSSVKSTVVVNGGGTFEFADTGCGFTGITLKVLDGSNIRMALDANGASNDQVKILALDAAANTVYFDTGATELAAGKTYTLLTVNEQLDSIDVSKFALKDQSYLGLYDTTFAIDTEKKAITLSLTQKENSLVWSGANTADNKWDNETTNTPWLNSASEAVAYTADKIVNFAKTAAADEREVSISGDVVAADAYVTGTGWKWAGEGSVETTGKLVLGDGKDATSLEISSTGNKKFTGGIELSENSTLIVKDDSNWSATTRGTGTVEIATGKAYDTTGGSVQLAFVNTILGDQPTEDSIGVLRLSNGTSIKLNSANANSWEWLRVADTLEIVDGANVQMAFKDHDYAGSRCASTIRLAGAGSTSAVAGSEAAAALAFTHVKQTGFNSTLELLDDATIYAAEGVSAGFAAWDSTSGHVLTKTGAGNLILATTGNATGLDIKAGNVVLKGASEIKVTGTQKLVDGTGLLFFSTNNANAGKMVVEALDVSGKATVGMLQSGSCYNGTVAINKLTGTADSTLTLTSGAKINGASVLELAGNGTDVAAADAYKGTIKLFGNVDGGTGRNLTLVITDGTMTANSVIDVAENVADRHNFGIGVNDSVVSVAGLTSSIATGANVTIYSGAAACGATSFSSDGIGRTLSINVAELGNYSTNATVLNAINIEKKGAGAQTFTGDMTQFDGNISVVAGTLTIDAAAENAGAISTYDVDIKSGATAVLAEGVVVENKLTSAGSLTTTKITGEGSVEITGGTVTLSDATDAFANTGTTSIAGATLAGTWTAVDVTIGAGVTASGTITLANSTINSTMTASGKISLANSTINSTMRTTGEEGSVVLSGDVTVGVTGVKGDAFYTHNGTVDAAGNGFESASTDYALVDGTSTAAEGTKWLIGGTAATNATYANGTLTVKTDAIKDTYWVNTGTVSYDGADATYGDTAQSLADTTGIMLNGGTLKLLELTTGSVTDGYISISASDKGGTLDVNGQSITQAVFGTLEGTVKLSGTGSYDLGTGVTALATNVALAENVAPGTGWTGTVKMKNVTLGNDAYKTFAANKLEVTNATISNQLVMNGGTLTLAGEMDVTGLSYETTVTWSSGNEGTGFSFTSREMKVVDTTAGGSIVKGDALSWKADGEYVFDFDTSDGELAMNDAAWTTVYNIAAGDMARYSADVNDSDGKKFINTDGIAATSIVMNGSSLYMETGLADNLVDGGIVVNSMGNTISLLGSEVTLAKGSLSVQEGATVELVGNGGIYDLSADADNTTLGAGVSISSDWAGTVKMGDVTATGEVDLSSLGNGSSTVLAGAVSVGSLTGTSVNMTADSVALTTGASTLGTLTTGALTLGGADSVGSLAVGTLDVTSGVITFNQLAASQLAIGELGTSLDLDISESLLLTAVSQTESKSLTLMTVTDLDGKTITLNGKTKWDSADKQYTYELGIDTDGVVTITSKLNGLVWAGNDESNTWSEGASWSGDAAPTADASVVFNGTGCSEVIVLGEVTAQSVTIDVGAEIEPEDIETESYEFIGSSTKDTLTIEKNLSVNKGTLVLGVNTSVAGRTEVVAGAELDVMAGNLASQYGFNNAGTLNIGSTSQTATLVSVAGGDMVNTGTINNEASLHIGTGSPDAATAAPNLINSGTIASSGSIAVEGDLVNSGTGMLEQTGGSLMVLGSLNNSATVEVSGAATQVTLGSVVNSGTLAVQEGIVVIGASDDPGLLADGGDVQNGDLDNSNGTITLGTDSTSASLTVNGDITGNDGGSITVMEGSTLTVTGDLNNAGGSLTLSGEDATAKIGGDLIMKDGASEGVLTVGQDASLTVDGKLAASEMMLEFGGNVTVGGDVEIGTLTNKGEFIANGSEDTEVHIGTLNNADGTLTVGVMQNGVLTGGNLEIGTLTGTGVVNVGEGGTLSIDTDTAFTGQLNNLGTLTITNTTLDSAQLTEEQTAGNIITKKLTVTDNAIGYDGGSYKLGDVATDTLVIDGTSSMAAGSTRLSMESLAAKTADGKVIIVLSDVEEMVRGTGDATDSSYHLITSADGTEKPFLAGSITEKLDLSRYGYDENGEYDATKASVQSDYMQHLLQQNKYVVFSDSDPLAGTATLDVATGTSDLYAAITELSEELSVWNLDGAHDMTEAGLTVLKGGKLVSDDILDNVQKVVVTGEQSLELTGKQDLAPELDLSHVTLNNLTASEDGTPVTLSISGDSSATDSATITTAADGFAGTLALSKVSADITGKVDTIEVGSDLNAMLDVSDADINLGSRDATFGGNLKGGSINFGVGSTELGVSVMKGDLAVNGTAINVQQTDSAIVIGGVGLGDEKTVIADLDSTKGSAAVTLIGKGYDKYFENARLEGGNVVADRNDSYATDKMQPSTENGAAGAELLDNLLVEINPQATAPDSDMAKLLDAVDTDRMSDETAAALAGSSISALGLALSGDVERQLRSIRNRTTTMGVNECVVNEGMPYFNAWFNTESNRTKLDSDSTNPGYTLDSWGGTVGFDVDVNPNFTMGLAISAMYGSITAEGPDSLDGDMDTYYLSLFARYADCAWTHTFVATLGKMDGSYSRTIPGWGATDASIDGTSFGLMYEVGYVIPLDEDGEACVQPIFNVMLRHSSVGSFTEDGDLGLDVDKQGMTTLTFGLGARMQAVVGESIYNRASIFEGRILAKADLGDRQSEADVSLVNGGSHKATVKSAELGTIGLELGAGLTIPLGDDDGSLFFDASVELRSGYTDVNGTVGYRINF